MGWNRCCLYLLVANCCLAIVTPSFAAYETNLESATSWLDSQQNSDGSWGSAQNAQFLYTVETVEALREAGRRNSAYYRGVTWLENHAADNADYQARRALALAPHGDDVMTDVVRLEGFQDALNAVRNGWGANGHYLQSALDTAIVLNTLSTLGQTVNTQAAVNYLKFVQLSDAGWPVAFETAGDPMTTAWVIKALAPLRSLDPELTTHIGNGVAFLATAIDGSAPHHLLALASHAALLADDTALATSWLDALGAAQADDGSWSNRVYDTALAVRAMSVADGNAEDSTPVNVPDANLRAAINAELGRNALDTLDREALSRLTTLTADGLGIADLTGLEWAVNLDNPDLRDNEILSTAPIDHLSPSRLLLAGNPVTEDTDSDGMPDEWETAFGLDIANDDRLDDPDTDGFANFLEYIEYTDPTDPASKPLAKYYILDPLTAQNDLTVISLYDDNVIQAGGTILELGAFQAATLPAADLSQGTLIWGEKPFSIGGPRDATDMPVAQARFAALRLVIPHVRNTHRYYLMSPEGDATVSVTTDDTPFDVLVPEGQVVTVEAGSSNGITGILESDLPILAAHAANTGGADESDAYPVFPPAKSLWGIRSRDVTIGGLEDNTQVTVEADDGTTESFTLNAGGSRVVSIGSGALQGEGSALHIVADKPVAAVQTADGDGVESTAFFDETGLGDYFVIPVDAQYIAVACVIPGTGISLFRSDIVEIEICSESGTLGKAYFGDPSGERAFAAGAFLLSNEPVYVIYESNATGDEHNLLGTTGGLPQ